MNPDVKVVITVSPVPMAQTFTDSDVFAANTYSKSVLRVASEALKGNFEFVDYFPSYEMVMSSPRAMTWADDQIHVAPPVVERVISRSEEHTSELQSLMRISSAAFCLKKN